MDYDKLAAAGVNFNEGLQRFMGNQAIYEKFVLRFPNDPTFAALDAAMEKKDVTEAFRMAHTLKGAAGNLSFNTLFRDVQPLVEALRAGDMAGAEPLYPVVKADYQAVLDAIQA